MGHTSVADPNPGFGAPLLRDPGWSKGRIQDKQAKSVNSLYTKQVGPGIRCFFTMRIRDPDRGGSNDRIGIRDKTFRSRNTGQTKVI
jgi:hypothetical protein